MTGLRCGWTEGHGYGRKAEQGHEEGQAPEGEQGHDQEVEVSEQQPHHDHRSTDWLLWEREIAPRRVEDNINWTHLVVAVIATWALLVVFSAVVIP